MPTRKKAEFASVIREMEDAVLVWNERFLSPSEAAETWSTLRPGVSWTVHHIRLFGRIVPCPRLSAWYGDEGTVYRYSGLVLHPQPWLPALAALRDRVSDVAGVRFNSVLLNLYRDGADSMGWHADDEPELGAEPVIASVSLGATRTMRFRHVRDRSRRFSMDLTDGSLLLMAGPTQHFWQHEIPKTKRVVTERINLTFRRIVG